ncbi:MAG TPA: AmmeMemoRadiSam system protein B [Verrucomicrobiota bacterium]|nr:AmmeMemoRadiSam system protein B [Verrucomicrobiota bacterium]
MPSAAPKTGPLRRVREPAVAGLFYPRDPAALGRAIDGCLAQAREESIPGLRALVCPHAGYTYSGITAAHGYRLLPGREVSTVILLAPSHYARVEGACVSGNEVFRTPLGDVPIAPMAAELARTRPFVPETPCPVHRPPWAYQSSRPMPSSGTDTADTWEHSDEVQVPFLQRTLKDFALVPVVMGDVDPAEAARALAGRIDDRTLLVASSDLSHYHPYEEARRMDQRTVAAICRLDTRALAEEDACGRTPILTLLHLARAKGWKARLLDYRNSGDTGGDKSGVVGYAAIAFFDPGPEEFTIEQRRCLLELARQSLRETAARGLPPEVHAESLPSGLDGARCCFVTLTKGGALRGCIGNLKPNGPLFQAVVRNASSAAIRDYRFPRVQTQELDQIQIEISVLTEPKPLAFDTPEDLLSKLRPHRDGVILQIGAASATYLPQVWLHLPDKTRFLQTLSEKAGAGSDDWRKPGVRVLTYQAEVFRESE